MGNLRLIPVMTTLPLTPHRVESTGCDRLDATDWMRLERPTQGAPLTHTHLPTTVPNAPFNESQPRKVFPYHHMYHVTRPISTPSSHHVIFLACHAALMMFDRLMMPISTPSESSTGSLRILL